MRNLSKLVLQLVFVSMTLISCKKDSSSVDFSMDLINTNDLIKEIIEEIQINYADDVAREKLEIGAINGMLGILDEHSLYISSSDFNAYNQSARGSFLGIGVEIKQVKDGIEVQTVIDDSPASSSGIKALDVITKINEKDIQTMNLKEIVSKLSSDSALKVKLSILRNKNEKFDLILRKSVIQLRSVKLDFIDDIALVKINYFNEGTLLAVSQSIKKINKKKSKGVIIDLRNNPGGILDQAVGVSDLFLSNQKIIELKSRNVEESRAIFSDDTDLLNGLPMAVLINPNTASGAELMASALGENKRAILIGEKTYGKGSLQTVIPIPGRGAIKLTTAYFVSPNGNQINQNGVTPDIEISKENTQTNSKKDIAEPIIQRAMDLLHGISALGESEKNK